MKRVFHFFLMNMVFMRDRQLPTKETSEHVFAEQVRLMFSQTKKATIGGLLSCTLFAAIFWHAIDPFYIASWFLLIVLLLSARAILYLLFLKDQRQEHNLPQWNTLYLLLTFAFGFAIGSASLVIHLTDDIAFHFLIIAWFVGYSALSVSAYSMNLKAVLALCLPLLSMLFVSIILVGTQLHLLTAGALTFWCIMVAITMRPVNHSMIKAIKLNYELAIEIEKRTLVETQLRELSIRDGLTGLFNRRHFDDTYEKELKRAQRNQGELSIALIDIDCFKQFNDTYGHQEGDDCLRKVCNAISQAVKRPTDLVARYGGEEFVVLLPNTNGEQTLQLVEQMRNSVLALAIPHEQSAVAQTPRVSVSIGIATLGTDANPDNIDLLKLADKALYQAKNSGRNQTVVFVP